MKQIISNWVTNCMEQSSSWQANRSLSSQEISHILWNAKVNYHINNCLLPVPILNQINPVHSSPSHFCKIHFNVIQGAAPSIYEFLRKATRNLFNTYNIYSFW